MKDEIVKNIEQKIGISNIVKLLAERLSGSELNSLLLEIFNKKIENISPALLLKQYRANGFVHPAETDLIGLLKMELRTLEFLQQNHFQPIELSPASQFGSCSVVSPTDQKKIISATRNTEIVADATNSIALHIADLKKSGVEENILRFCTIQRHIRTQPFKGAGFTQHFKIGCMVSSGRDTGSNQFECANLLEHILTLNNLFIKVFNIEKIRFKILPRGGYDDSSLLIQRVINHLTKEIPGINITVDESPPHNNYYKGIQFKMIIEINDKEFEIADGGFVDWTQQLLENKKERLLISGFGFDLLYKLQNKL
ncbi:MAG TPA: hypothetical protein VGN20_17550 [Mucilaginibacter sp.]|jgi:hypothetical protein